MGRPAGWGHAGKVTPALLEPDPPAWSRAPRPAALSPQPNMERPMSPSMHPPDTLPFLPGDDPTPVGPPDPPTWLTHKVMDVLRRHPGTALPLEQLHERVQQEGTPVPERTDHFARSLACDPRRLHLLIPRRRRWAGLAPRPWVLARSPVDPDAAHPILHLLRETLRLLGQAVDPESTVEMARWERYLMEEAEVHQSLGRRLRRKRGERRSSTTPLPGLPPGSGILRPRRLRASPGPRPEGCR